LQRKRNFRRLQDIDLDEFEIKTIFLDPPREGLDVFTIQNLINVENIIYISCGFESFKRDLKILQKNSQYSRFSTV
jgi:tRNA (uracil-5-)-methyltransferase